MKALTVAICTYNRAPSLLTALRALVAQRDPATPFEIIVVDNNSTDGTCGAVQSFGAAVRYIFEPRQGLSHARNTAIEAATGDIIAFTDDDVEVGPGWAAVLQHAVATHPDVDCFGGRVLPRWHEQPPVWLTRAHWGPLALQDHGEEPRIFDAQNPLCLIGANVAFRRSVFARVGHFSPLVQRVKDGIGSTEDHELLLRLYADGGRALYLPDLLVTTEIPQERLTREYHRRWHRGH
ncbi:MAG TPA: glycosyltransferase, partial [Vicinamibacterales bacterium]|nr:glycosyltransferase [Vicinamibacterales bacterium]